MTSKARLVAAISIFTCLGAAVPAIAQDDDRSAAARAEAVADAVRAEREALAAEGKLEELLADSAARDCDRACLDGVARAYLDSVVSHDVSGLVMGHNIRVTEDGQEIQPGEGYWQRAGALRQHRLNILDPYWEVAAGLAVMDNALLAYRIKADDGVITEIETFVVEPDDGGETLARETLAVPRDDFLRRVDPVEQNSRTELLELAQYYPDGLKGGSFAELDAPFPDDAERMENGMILAGPRCTFNENCGNMKNQPSPERPTLRQRVLAVDEEQGIVFMWLDWMQASGMTLEVYEAFKIYGGQLHDVEAFIEHGDPAVYPGWPIE